MDGANDIVFTHIRFIRSIVIIVIILYNFSHFLIPWLIIVDYDNLVFPYGANDMVLTTDLPSGNLT